MTSRPWTGRPLRRLEDERLLLGRGQYIEDLTREGMARVSYYMRPSVVDACAPMESDARIVHAAVGTNEAFSVRRTAGDVAAAFARAHRLVPVRLRHARVAAIPIEPRGVLAWTDVA